MPNRNSKHGISNSFDFIQKVDMFGKSLPNLNIAGEEKIRTNFGGTISFLIMMLTTSFALLKLQHLLEKKNPTIVRNEIDFESFEDGIYDTSENDFSIAVALTNIWGDVKADPKFL